STAPPAVRALFLSPTATPAVYTLSLHDALPIFADTHVPKRARDLPAPVWAAIGSADVVVHAGDWVDVALLDAIEQRARRLVAVVGNNDGPDLRARLPETARADLDGVRLTVVHETGAGA